MVKVFERNIGDSVWVMHDNKAVNGKICGLRYCKFLSVVDFETVIEKEYIDVAFSNNSNEFQPNQVFSTKEDLLNSL